MIWQFEKEMKTLLYALTFSSLEYNMDWV